VPHAALNAVLPTFEYRGAVSRWLGQLARLLGRERDATAHLKQAIAINRELRMPRATAMAERALAATTSR
jgi:hypothetical protein